MLRTFNFILKAMGMILPGMLHEKISGRSIHEIHWGRTIPDRKTGHTITLPWVTMTGVYTRAVVVRLVTEVKI